ncbi:MAG: ATP-binding cassette domain-containing protein [Gammaproteobacteria bacterium]|nr:ATP-binding cassette domain-containing protein [Gammaproteobacteria bacterium]
MNANNFAIEVKGLCKRYRIGLKEERHENLASALVDFVKSPLRNYRQYRSLYDFSDISPEKMDEDSDDVIWPLKNISFNVHEGEVVGVIGRNGAGKSTLLKILSKITPPTVGEVRLKGRISSLLEVGTGFHNELTGRENVYLNGTILGMRKREVDRKFDQIVEFSGVEKFLDTPVKRYSSGMRVRLAFAVSAHLEPEILIIDEVLAVGDADFQRKCLDKMQDVGQQGRTVLFVSHNMNAITRLCGRVILLEDGRVSMDGPAHDVVSHYMSSGAGLSPEKVWPDLGTAPGDQVVRVVGVRIKSEDGQIRRWVDIHKPIVIEMEYEVLEGGHDFATYCNIFNEVGVKICTSIDRDSGWHNRPRPVGRYISRVRIPSDLLNEGLLYITPVIKNLRSKLRHFYMREAVGIQVVEGVKEESDKSGFAANLGGVIRPHWPWETDYLSDKERKNAAV